MIFDMNKNHSSEHISSSRLPAELKTGIPVIHIFGYKKIEIVNYLGITEYNDHVVRIRTKCKIVEITGNELGITFLHDEHMLVEGHIQQIQFLFE